MYWYVFPIQGIIWEAKIGESLLSHSCDLHSLCGAGGCQGQGQSPPTLAEGWKPRMYLLFLFWLKKSDQVQNFPLGNKGQSQIKICFWNCEVWTDLFAPAPAAQGISYPSPSPLRMPRTDTTPGTALQRVFHHGVHPSAGTLPTSSGPHFDTMQKKPSGCLKPISKIHCSRDKRCVFKRPISRDTKRYLWDSS